MYQDLWEFTPPLDSVPTLTTTPAISIIIITAISGGNVVSNAGFALAAEGFVGTLLQVLLFSIV